MLKLKVWRNTTPWKWRKEIIHGKFGGKIYRYWVGSIYIEITNFDLFFPLAHPEEYA